ncbi:MAG: mucoidy inhibitor MuiA family protein [Alphaproteobacteria bacterium]|nr:mucoidy inhibitor MuiA family protein [Alphaproteobacteria bacterium]
MHMTTKTIAVVCLLAVVAPGRVLANTIETGSKVSSVTVFADRAAVTRAGSARVPAGAHVLVIGDLPAGFDEASLRVQGTASAAVKIGSVDVKRLYLSELAAAAEQEKAKALQAKRDEKAMNDAELKALQTRAGFIEHLAFSPKGQAFQTEMSQPAGPQRGMMNPAMPAMQQDLNPRTLDLLPEKWPQAWGALQTGMAETQKALVTKNIAAREIDQEIAKLEKEYNQIKTAKRERRQVIVHVEARDETEFNFTINYQVNGVSWRPIYDARLSTDKAELRLEQYGRVSQQTGEDWQGIELVFSTARPELGTEMPKMQEWYIQPVEMMRQATFMSAETAKVGRAAPYMMTNMDAAGGAHPGSMAAKNEPVAAEPEPMKLVATGYTAEFHVPGRVDLKSIAEPSKFFVGAQTMKADMNVQATPRLGEQAYLFAKVTNKEKYPVIPGHVAKYRDGAFIGNSDMQFLRPDEATDLSFGVDDRITVSYQKIKQEQNNPALVYVGDITAERYFRSKIKNLHKSPLRITVLDQYPVSRDPDVKVRLIDDSTTKGYVKDKEDRQGVLTWTADFQPQEEKTFDLAFSVKYPKEKRMPEF